MARIRTIKPEFGENEDLASVSIYARLTAALLPCHADREGRLEDRPARLKVKILPYDDRDMNALLDELQGIGFIQRYEVEGQKLIQIVNFSKHQRPNIREPESELPPCTCTHVQNNSSTKKIYETIHDSIPVPFPSLPDPVPTPDPDPEQLPVAITTGPSFDEFWELYPRKDCKKPARECWKKLSSADQAAVVADIPQRMANNWAGRERDKIPQAPTYLNQRRWEDPIEAGARLPTNGNGHQLSRGVEQLVQGVLRAKDEEKRSNSGVNETQGDLVSAAYRRIGSE